MSMVFAFLKRFGLFWYDFIVGDSMTLAIGTLSALILAAAIAYRGSVPAEVALPVAIGATLSASLWRR